MLTIWDENRVGLGEFCIHVGAGRIKDLHPFPQIGGVRFQVQADGHELEKIVRQFSNIPMTTNRVVRWSGETARFIVENLDL